MASLTGRIDTLAQETEKIEIPDSKKIEKEIKELKESIRLLQSLHPPGNAGAKPKKKGKGASSRPAVQG